MTVRVQFFAQLRDVAGASQFEVEMADGATVEDLLARVYAQKAPLRAHDKTMLFGVGVEFVGRDYIIRPGDEIAIMPPVQGG